MVYDITQIAKMIKENTIFLTMLELRALARGGSGVHNMKKTQQQMMRKEIRKWYQDINAINNELFELYTYLSPSGTEQGTGDY